MPVIQVGKTLREKLGEEGVQELIDLINSSQQQQKEDILTFVEEKFERRLSEEISKLRVDMVEMNQQLRSEMVEMNQQLRGEMVEQMAGLRTEISQTRAELIKWMFIFWVGQVGMILGILLAFFK
ncbi:MAG TPA: hypothetical protein ENJ66_03245 [Calditrichae bacterium]|nr:hypothetical protein [Calditrichia bacterium]